MQYSSDEIKKLKAMLLYLVQKLDKKSDGHSGFHVKELEPILDDMVKDGVLQKRQTIHVDKYFLTKTQ